MIRLTNTNGNWDHYLNESGYVESIAISEGCGNSVYGPISHFLKNLEKGVIKYNHLTEFGKELALKHGYKK